MAVTCDPTCMERNKELFSLHVLGLSSPWHLEICFSLKSKNNFLGEWCIEKYSGENVSINFILSCISLVVTDLVFAMDSFRVEYVRNITFILHIKVQNYTKFS